MFASGHLFMAIAGGKPVPDIRSIIFLKRILENFLWTIT